MKVTIIPTDGVVQVDGRAIKLDLTDMQPNIHAVQWDGTTGHVEYNDGSPNALIDNLADFQPWLTRWYAARAIEDAPPPPPTPEQIQASLTAAMDRHIDGVARAKGYDSRITCAMRAGYVNPWQTECIAFGQWMDQCYLIGLAILNDVQSGTRPVPTAEALIAELPVMVWP
jgi:hypothetical protein